MTFLSFNFDSFNRGGVTRDEAIEALDDPMCLEVETKESKLGNPTVLYVGMTLTEKLLEIGVEYLPHETHIFHARKANSKNKRKYLDQLK